MWDFLRVCLIALMLSIGYAFSNDDAVEIEAPKMPAILMPPVAPCSCTAGNVKTEKDGSGEDEAE